MCVAAFPYLPVHMQVRGTYGLCFVDKSDPDVLVGARSGSPLILGIGENDDEYFLASDASAIVQYTNKVRVFMACDALRVPCCMMRAA